MTDTPCCRGAVLVLILLFAVPASVLAGGCPNDYNNFNGPLRLYLNVHNCGTDCADEELPYLERYREGITGVRISPVQRDLSMAPEPEFYEVNDFDPYFDGALEIFGPNNVLVVVDDNVDEGPHAKPRPGDMVRKLRSTLDRHPGVRHIEFMNEPSNFSGISPEEYVGRYLPRARQVVDEYNANRAADDKIILYSAAWFGNPDGARETHRMVTAGGLRYVDVMAVHIYAPRTDDARSLAREYKRLARGKPIAVTETNFNTGNESDYETQQWWLCQSMAGVEATLRSGLSPEKQALQHNVFYTLRADEVRLFNIIRYPDSRNRFFWQDTGPGHFVIKERAAARTDPKPGRPAGDLDPGDGEADGEGEGEGEPIGPPRPPGGRGD